ncbi:MAG: hypothetical protein U1E65_22175 [Myxococcota bacterium]
MEMTTKERVFGALGLVILGFVLACATLWVGHVERGGLGRMDATSRRLVDLAGSGDAQAVRVLELAIRRRPVAYARALFVALRERCAVRCDGIDGLVLAAWDRASAAGRDRGLLPRGKWAPRFRRQETGRPMAIVRSRAGYYRFPVGREVMTVLLRAIGRDPRGVRGVAGLMGLPEVRRELCAIGAGDSSPGGALRAGFCALAGAPSGDPARLCSAVAADGDEGGRLAKLTDRQQKSLQELCAAAGGATSSEGFTPPGLETLVGPGCVDMLEGAVVFGASAAIDPDATVLAKSLQCMGVKEEPTRPIGHGVPGRGSVAFYRASDNAEGTPDPWRQPAEDDRGWSYAFNVLDPEANALNAAHVGDRGFIAVFAVESSAEEGTIAVEIVATSNEGDIGIVIVETGVPLDTLDVLDSVPVLTTVLEGMRVAAVQATTTGYNGVSPPPEASSSPSDDDEWEETPEESNSPEASSDEKDGAFSGPLGDPSACRELEAALLRGPSGEPSRAAPGKERPPADPRASHPKDEVAGVQDRACGAATVPRACGALDCRNGTLLDSATCTCRAAAQGARPSRAGCMAARCPEGTQALAVGPLCTCADAESGALAKPSGPRPDTPVDVLRGRAIVPR